MDQRIDIEKLSSFFEEKIPFNRVLGLKVVALQAGGAQVRVPYSETLIGDPSKPAIHGGVISALADAAGGLCVWSTLTAGCVISTIDLRIDYLLPGEAKDLIAHATLLRSGQRVGVADIAVTQPGSQGPIAQIRAVYSLKRAPKGLVPAED
jgi:uncharacterized protein (TIGR00369 family)